MPPTGGSFLLSHSASPPRTAEASAVAGGCHPRNSSGSAHLFRPRPFLRAPPTATTPPPFRRLRPQTQVPAPPSPGSRGAEGAPGPPTCAEGNWGTASRSSPCSWEWMLARARWDRVSLCGKPEGGRRSQRLTPPAHLAPSSSPGIPKSRPQPRPPPPGSLARSPNLLKGVGDGLVAEEIIAQDV